MLTQEYFKSNHHTTMETQNELKQKLYEPLPEKAVTQHPTKTYLSSIKAIYVTDRFNEVFGIGKWTTKAELIKHNEDSGMVVVKVIFEVPTMGFYYESFGGNDNGGKSNKNFDLGDAFKGATTDAITKIGSYLGVGIDVFRGEANPSPAKKGKDDKKKDWLNHATPEWKNAIDKNKTLNDVREFYKVSKANAEKYEQELNAVNHGSN